MEITLRLNLWQNVPKEHLYHEKDSIFAYPKSTLQYVSELYTTLTNK